LESVARHNHEHGGQVRTRRDAFVEAESGQSIVTQLAGQVGCVSDRLQV
jgi:hypothetical protein